MTDPTPAVPVATPPPLSHANEVVTASVTEQPKPPKRPRLQAWMAPEPYDPGDGDAYTMSAARPNPSPDVVKYFKGWTPITIPGEDEVADKLPSWYACHEQGCFAQKRLTQAAKERDVQDGLIATLTRERDEARAKLAESNATAVKIARERNAAGDELDRVRQQIVDVRAERDTLRQQLADERKALRNMLGSLKYASACLDESIAAAETRLKGQV